ncbi:MAG: IS701 family transposase [Solirubrobacteraceae bacterium]
MPVLPSSLMQLLVLLRPAFTAPSFQTFEALVAGMIGRVGERTVCGMWQAARLAGRVHHSVGHDFFARSRWSTDEVGLRLLDFLIERFVDADAPISLAVDGSVFGRSGRNVHGAVWHHDASAGAGGAFKYGNCFVVVGLVVRIAVLGERAWCLPVLFRLWLPTPKATTDCPDPERHASQQDLAAVLIGLVAGRHPGRRVDVVGDSAFACKATGSLADAVTLTSRLRANAVIYAPKPPPTGKRGRPRVTGQRLGNCAQIAAAASRPDWQRVDVPGRGEATVLVTDGLWYSVFGARAVRVLIVRESADSEGYEIALITTDLDASPAQIIARYADRWSIEVCFQDAKHVAGVGEARNRVKLAVERTVPFGLLCQTITIAWYALHGDPAGDVRARRLHAPWYPSKRDPSMLDIQASLRRELIRSEYHAQAGRRPIPAQTSRPSVPPIAATG